MMMKMMMLVVAVCSNQISTHSIEFSHPWSSPYCVANGNWILASTILEMWGCFRIRITALANFWGMTTSTSTWNSCTCWVHIVTLSSVEINRPLSAPLATFGSGLCQVKKNIFIWCDDIDDEMATLKWIHSVPFLSFHHILKSGQFLQVLPLKRGRDLANANTLRIGRLPWLVVRRAISASTTGGKWRLVTRDWRIASATDSFKTSGHAHNCSAMNFPSWASSMDL